MSANPLFPDEICLKPAELYLLIQQELAVHKICDILEKGMSKSSKVKDKKRKAIGLIQIYLALGLPRPQIIEKLKDIYSKDYAEKLFDNVIRDLNKILEGGTGPRIVRKPLPVKKGRFGRPGSREARAGRPPIKYKFEETPTAIKYNERLKALSAIGALLSGSYIRLIKLVIRWMREDPVLSGLAIEALGGVVKHNDAFEKSFKEALSEDSEKLIDKWYSEIMEPIWREIPSILGSNLPITDNTRI